MATIQLPSGRYVQLQEDMSGKSPQEVAGAVYAKISDIPDFQEDASQLAQKYDITTTGIGQAVGGTAGGIGGALALGSLGAAGGPLGIGIGALAGSVLGSAGLGAAGEAIEAELSDVEGDVLGAATEEGLYGLIPGGAGVPAKGLAQVSRLAGKFVPKALESEATRAGSKLISDWVQKIPLKYSREYYENHSKKFITDYASTKAGKQAIKEAGVNKEGVSKFLNGLDIADQINYLGNTLKVPQDVLIKAYGKALEDFALKDVSKREAIKRILAAGTATASARASLLDSNSVTVPTGPGPTTRGLL